MDFHKWIGLGLLVFSLSVQSRAEPSIRVAILKADSKLIVAGEELRLQLPEPKPVSYYLASPALVEAAETGLSVNQENFPHDQIDIWSLNSPLTIQGKHYQGRIEIHRQPDHRLLVLNELPLETYLIGLIHGEMHASWPKEALKAQVVAARTYALFRQKKRGGTLTRPGILYDLENTFADQVYLGSKGAQDVLVQKAIGETQGEVLWYLGYYPAYFHSCCGGQTEMTDRVWGQSEVSSSVVDRFCERAPFRNWQLVLPTKAFLKKLRSHGLEGNRLLHIQREKWENGPRNVLVEIATDKMTLFLSANDLRRILGYDQLKSTWFDLQQLPQKIVFTGSGYGHGVGLCQWGAKAMAEAGKTYRDILQFYYPKAIVKKVY